MHEIVLRPKLYVGSLLVGIVSMQIACTQEAQEQKQKVKEKELPKQPISFEPDSLEKHPQKKVVIQPKKSKIEDPLISMVTCYEVAYVPSFNFDNFQKWVQEHVQYPQVAIDSSYEGKVMVSFELSNLDGVTIIKSSGYRVLDNEAIRVVKLAFATITVDKNSSEYNQVFQLPILFKLEKK